jgi:hypothetical protein
MSVEELIGRFPEIPRSLHGEPLLARLANAADEPLRQARKPSACATAHDAPNHFYLKLIGPLAIHGYGLTSRDKVLGQIQDLVERSERDPTAFVRSLLPEDTAAREQRGPGCD